MKLQKMTKEAVGIGYGIESTKSLKETSTEFKNTFNFLLNGNEELDIPKTENDTIVEQINLILNKFDGLKTNIESLYTDDIYAIHRLPLNLQDLISKFKIEEKNDLTSSSHSEERFHDSKSNLYVKHNGSLHHENA